MRYKDVKNWEKKAQKDQAAEYILVNNKRKRKGKNKKSIKIRKPLKNVINIIVNSQVKISDVKINSEAEFITLIIYDDMIQMRNSYVY